MSKEFTFEADDKPLSEIFFETSRVYRIPRYQREYEWDSEKIAEFWEDLSSSDEPYFLGSFIFNTEKEKNEGYVDIIDGQQRLITITILSAVIRDLAKDLDPESFTLFQSKDIAIIDWLGHSSYRIIPAESLEQYFVSYIQSGKEDILQSNAKTPEEKRVLNTYKELKDRVAADLLYKNNETQLNNLNNLRGKLRALKAINVEISREEDAYDIFETTNARGMELSVSDLLKNLIFKNIQPGDGKDFAKELWDDIIKNVEQTNTEVKRFIRYYWISKYNFVQEKRLYKEIKKKIPQSQWEKFLQDLWEDLIRYNHLLEGDLADFQEYGDHRTKIYELVFALRLMNVSQCFVLLLSILRNFNRLGFDPYRFFQFLERFTFQYAVICKLPGNRVEKIYSKYALEIEKAAKDGPSERVTRKLQSVFSSLENELKAEAPSETLFMEGFSDLEYKNSEDSRRMIKYVLGRVNGHYKHTDEYIIDFSRVNIEHLLPQNPDKEWKLSKKEIKTYVNNIGNLTLLSQVLNSKAQNAIVAKKLPELKKSELEMNKVLVKTLEDKNCEWGDEQIGLRQKELAEIAYESVWVINKGS